jgi:Holliday junction resolvase RusA-like endonuclease
MIGIDLRCVPPSVTAQQKRLRIVRGRPMFFHGQRMREQEQTWTALLAPHVPDKPVAGPLSLSMRLIYPHLKSARKRDRSLIVPKGSKPDADNVAKHIIDLLSRLRFIEDDQSVARLIIEKYFGPEAFIGIRIQIAPMTGASIV